MNLSIQSRHDRVSAAFTLVEMMLALTLASIVGVVILLMLRAFVFSVDPRFSVGDAVADREVARLRMSTLLRGSSTILGATGNKVALWTGDWNGDGLPNLSELRLLEFKQSQGEVWAYGVPEGSTPSVDTSYLLNSDFVAVLSAIAGLDAYPGHIVLAGVSDWHLECDKAVIRDARVVRLKLKGQLAGDSNEHTVIASLRGSPEM